MSETKEIKCSCQSEYQDAKYGPGVRVFNKMKGTEKMSGGYRCTVCGTVKK